MEFIITHEEEECRCPICEKLLFHTKPEDGWTGDEDIEWSESMLCCHVRAVYFPQACTYLFRDKVMKEWWEKYEEENWLLDDVKLSDPDKGWKGDPDGLENQYRIVATKLKEEQPDVSHYMVSELDCGGGPAPSWITQIVFSEKIWPNDEWS